jgi:8-oxo-dGTP pyrophosphatase MutT (NUDIX family)
MSSQGILLANEPFTCAALDREIYEETGWSLRRILDLLEVFDWETEHDEHGLRKPTLLIGPQVRNGLSYYISQ